MYSSPLSTTFPSLAALFVAFCFFSTLVAGDHGIFTNNKDFEDGRYGEYPRQTFISNPDVLAPLPNIHVAPNAALSPSRYILWTPTGPHLDANPMILDAKDLSLVWHGPLIASSTYGATVQKCNDTEYITFWSGDKGRGWLAGNYYMLNSNYEVVYNITAQGDLSFADAHELFITPQCTAIFTSYQQRRVKAVMPDGAVSTHSLESYFQEIDIATNQIVFQWNASEHVDLYDTFWNPRTRHEGHPNHGFDWFHINSVEKDHRGNYLVSSRHLHSLYYISGQTGKIIWQLGGRKNMFMDMSGGIATDFSWQHHARWVDADLTKISLFDNRNTEWHPDYRQTTSRGIILSLNYDKMTVTLEHEYRGTEGINSVREGSMQVLPDGNNNVILGYGQESGFTEYSANGTVLFDVWFAPLHLNRASPDNYRTLKVNWTSTPPTRPDIAPGPAPIYEFNSNTSVFAVRADGHALNDTVYFSWNGATEIASWVVLSSDATSDLNARNFAAEVPKSGFEGSLRVGPSAYVAVLALDGDKRILASSRVMDMSTADLLGDVTLSSTLWSPPGQDGRYLAATFALGCLGAVVSLVLLLRHVRSGSRQAYTIVNNGDGEEFAILSDDEGELVEEKEHMFGSEKSGFEKRRNGSSDSLVSLPRRQLRQ